VYGLLQIVHLEGHMRDGLDEVRNGRILPVPHPLDAEGIALMITHRDSQVGKIVFPFKASRCGDANVIELHSAVSISNRLASPSGTVGARVRGQGSLFPIAGHQRRWTMSFADDNRQLTAPSANCHRFGFADAENQETGFGRPCCVD
jgi:hypothetical protein